MARKMVVRPSLAARIISRTLAWFSPSKDDVDVVVRDGLVSIPDVLCDGGVEEVPKTDVYAQPKAQSEISDVVYNYWQLAASHGLSFLRPLISSLAAVMLKHKPDRKKRKEYIEYCLEVRSRDWKKTVTRPDQDRKRPDLRLRSFIFEM
ncbi:uncharacterized protein LACBIDRAFT_329757 [Laccaria bicolor S238N-H82]|uniref:Predicted protein n=1 Tax=Laccaria bicolor (strain S238N-H82 / ATCC MYA-4686) TaxID=486041 RepID=B0DJ47_LACBS|nr:uncharacterized protein LACBIDRAFT_329757 [Laccaria bicolor S238N-H82]EDR05459.1 predicted protein [Laccaria bicolor S238N-H82]|eukprot:XP_001884017.1 predicted protein [Laccaria bicolor S238N-H82]